MAGTAETGDLRLVLAHEGQVVIDSRLGGLGVITKLPGRATGGAFCVVEHPLEPLALGSPRHTHRQEDEMSYVLEGEIMVEIDGQVFRSGPGDLVFKPRGLSHAFWNPGPVRARILEIIVPARFEEYFAELGRLLQSAGPLDAAQLGKIAVDYDLDMNLDSVPELVERYHLRLGPPPPNSRQPAPG